MNRGRAGTYAQNTVVSSDGSQREIQNTLRKYGADKFGTMEENGRAYIMFGIHNLLIQVAIDLPKREDFETTDTGRARKESQTNLAYEQAVRQRWRSLTLLVKAKVVASVDGITTFEKEFLGDIVLPDGTTLMMKIQPQIEALQNNGKMPKLVGFIPGEGG